jgi:hypothetical protein
MNKHKEPFIVKLSSEERLKILANLVIDRILEDMNKEKLKNVQLNT